MKFLKITFLQNTSRRLLLDFFIHLTKLFFAIQWTNRNQVLYIFEHVLSWLLNVMNIMSFASGKLYFAKQTPHRSSHLHIFSKIGILKNVTNFTQKHLCWSCFLIKLQDKFNTHVFLWNLQNFAEHSGGCFLTKLLLHRKTHFSETQHDTMWNRAVFFRLINWLTKNIYIYIYIYIIYICNIYINYSRRHIFYQQWYFESYESSMDCYKQKM